jgi:outer membrane protein assembly factor BamD (BamD/ComL family)
VAELRRALRAKPDDILLHQRLHLALAADEGSRDDMLAHARDYLPLLLRQARQAQAVAILKTCVEKDPAFKPHGADVVALAKAAMAADEHALALRVMDKFDRLNPGHEAIPTVYYLSAKALRQMKRYDLAAKVLDALIARYPESPFLGEAKNLRAALDRLEQR